ncbi:hypothetical protein Moror_16667 [Moniliophthora roreri MCA 2997]|uniref:DUF6699 domain-containing protein n=2 Tax=Moniliophthora roreri TaxID=221103 RepID=V2WHA8_MONRO|nr:hypothetical protein Moror_16667 [Moniliophthora roreri MCA 2997]
MKHVRFAKTNTIYPPYIPSKSLSVLSSRTLPDELVHVATTPHPAQQIMRSRLLSKADQPHTSHFLKLAHAHHANAPMRLHFLLAFSPYKSPAIHYDLSLPFSIIEHSPSNSIMAEPATEPPVSSLTITSPMLQWDITVTPASPTRSYVSVLDVLLALCRDMHISVHPEEYEAIPSLEVTKKVNKAYFNRCRSIADTAARQAEEKRGVKRVDFLMGRNHFLGLSTRNTSRTGSGGLVWELNVD